jgi:hypothetical protein
MRLSTANYIFPLPITSFHCKLHLFTAKYIFPLPITSFHCQIHESLFQDPSEHLGSRI